MTFGALSAAWTLAGLAGLAALLFVLQQLRTRYRDMTVVTTMFWRQAAEEAPVRTLRERFRHPWAYALLLLIASLVWLALAEPRLTGRDDRTFHVLVLDASAGMAAGTHFQDAVSAIEREAARLPRDSRQVIWAGGELRPLLAPGEHELLLAKRLDARTPDAAPASVESLVRQVAAVHHGEGATAIEIFGDAPVGRTTLDRLPKSVTVTRAAAPTSLSGNAGITALGIADAASGAWDKVDVFVDVGGTADRANASAHDVRIDVDGRALTPTSFDGRSAVLRDVAADGGLLTVTLATADALALDNSASVRLPAKPVVKVTLSPALQAVLGPVLSADRGVSITTGQADVAIRRGGESIGAGLPALEFVRATTQPQAFLFTHPATTNAAAVFARAVDDIGLQQVDAMSLAQTSGRPIEVSIASGRQWRFSVWEDLLTDDYDFTRSRAFPLFIANAVRWLAGTKAYYPVSAAGAPLVAAGAGERGHVLSASGRAIDAPGADFIPATAGTIRLDANRPALAASLLDPQVTSGTHDNAVPVSAVSSAGFGFGAGLATWLMLAALVLLAWEWQLYHRGRVP